MCLGHLCGIAVTGEKPGPADIYLPSISQQGRNSFFSAFHGEGQIRIDVVSKPSYSHAPTASNSYASEAEHHARLDIQTLSQLLHFPGMPPGLHKITEF